MEDGSSKVTNPFGENINLSNEEDSVPPTIFK